MEKEIEEYLKKEGIKESDLTELAKMAIATNKKMQAFAKQHPDEKWLKEKLKSNTEEVIAIIQREIKNKETAKEIRQKLAENKRKKRSKSLKVVKKTKQTIQKLKNQQSEGKQEKGSPALNSTSRVAKVKEAFGSILKLMPGDDPKVIKKSEQLLKKCASELFKINKLNRIRSVNKELKEAAEEKREESKTD